MIQVRDTVITGRTGVFIANTAVVGLVDVVVAFVAGLCDVGLLLWTDDVSVMIVTGDVGFAGVVDDHLTLGTVQTFQSDW